MLPLSRLLEAAERTEDRVLICALQGNVDGHSHAASRRALTHILDRLTPSTRASACEAAWNTGLQESFFCLLSNNSTSGEKTDAGSIQQRLPMLDVAHCVKFEAQREGNSLACRTSKRQRKLGDKHEDWNIGSFKRAKYDADLDARARQHTAGSNNKSIRDFVKGRNGMGH